MINTAKNTVVATIPIDSGSGYLAVTPDNSKVYVTTNAGSVDVIATATNTVIATIFPVPGTPDDPSRTPDDLRCKVGIKLSAVRPPHALSCRSLAAGAPLAGYRRARLMRDTAQLRRRWQAP